MGAINDLFMDVPFADDKATEGKDGRSGQAPKDEPIRVLGKGEKPPKVRETSGFGYTARSFGAEIGKARGDYEEALITSNTPIEKWMRYFLPNDWVDKAFPLEAASKRWQLKEQGIDLPKMREGQGASAGGFAARRAGDLASKVVGPTAAQTTPTDETMGDAPGPWSKEFGHMARFMGGGATHPIVPGGPMANLGWRAMLSLGGGAAGSSLAGSFTESLARNVFGANDATAENAGDIARLPGAAVGGQLNVVKGNAITEAASAGYKGVRDFSRNVKDAAATVKNRPEGMGRWEAFTNNFAGLRDKTNGYVKQQVNGMIAEQLRNDPNSLKAAEQFEEAARRAGVDTGKFSLAEQTKNPVLVAIQRDAPSKSFEQSAAQSTRLGETQEELKKGFKIVEGRAKVDDAAGIRRQLNDLHRQETTLIKAKNAEGMELVDKELPRVDTTENHNAGKRLGELMVEQHDPARDAKNAAFSAAAAKADELGIRYKTDDVLSTIQDVNDASRTKLDPSIVPNSVEKLNKFLAQKGPNNTTIKPKLSLQEVYDARVTIGDDLKRLEGLSKTDAKASTQKAILTEVKGELDKLIESKSPAEVLKLHQDAMKIFEDYVDRFKTTTNKAILGTGKAFEGQERLDPASIVGKILGPEVKSGGKVSESNMIEFDKVFGGIKPGTKKVEEAYKILDRGVEDAYRDSVLKQGSTEFDLAKHEKFMRDNKAIMDRRPELANKLNGVSENLMKLQAETDFIKARFKRVTDSDLTKAWGKEQADRAVARAIDNPEHMAKMLQVLGRSNADRQAGAKSMVKEVFSRVNLWREGEAGEMVLDSKPLKEMLQRGSGTDKNPGGLRLAFRTAFGKEAGDEHFKNLQAIALLAERRELTIPRHLRPQEAIPVATPSTMLGTSVAGGTSHLLSVAQGRTSAEYIAAHWISRFANVKVQQAFQESLDQALYSPQKAKDVIKLAQAMNQKASDATLSTTMNVIGKAGKDATTFAKQLLDYGYIKPNAARATFETARQKKNKEPREETPQRHWSER